MKKEDIIIDLLREISDRLSRVEEQQIQDRENNKKEFEKINSQFEKIDSRFEKMEEARIRDKQEMHTLIEKNKQEMLTLIEKNKQEMLDRISSFEASSNLHFTSISNSLAYERTRVDVIYDERKDVTVHWSNKLMAMNSIFAGIVAFVVSSFK